MAKGLSSSQKSIWVTGAGRSGTNLVTTSLGKMARASLLGYPQNCYHFPPQRNIGERIGKD